MEREKNGPKLNSRVASASLQISCTCCSFPSRLQRPSFTRTKARGDAGSSCQGARRASPRGSGAVQGPWDTVALGTATNPTPRAPQGARGHTGRMLRAGWAAACCAPACACVCWRAFGFRRLYPGRGQVLVLARGGARPWLWEVSACLCSALCALPLRLLLLPWSAGAGTHPRAGQCSCRGPALLCLWYQGCPKFHVHTAACGLTYI